MNLQNLSLPTEQVRVELENVIVAFNSQTVLTNISYQVYHSARVALMATIYSCPPEKAFQRVQL
jgi:ABC-type molybdenum transport system ATPase subunit/photorepair protein PhrA